MLPAVLGGYQRFLMKETTLREIKQISKDVVAEYISLATALISTGLTREQFLKWAEENQVRTTKYKQRWLVHKKDLAEALRSS